MCVVCETLIGKTHYFSNKRDTYSASSEKSFYYGGKGHDKLTISGGYNKLMGQHGHDTLKTIGNNNTLLGNQGDDKLIAFGYASSLNGGSGHDKLIAKGRDHVLKGGSGHDKFTLKGKEHKALGQNGDDKIHSFGKDHLIKGGQGDDTITVKGRDSKIYGGQGDDTITLKGKNHDAYAGHGHDKITSLGLKNAIYAGNGDDQIIVKGKSTFVNGGDGDDLLRSFADNNTLNGGKGNDLLYARANANTLNGGAGDDDILAFGNQHKVSGGSGNDTIYVRGNESKIKAGQGNDDITADGNNHQINSGHGDNIIEINGDNNSFVGGSGIDNLTLQGMNSQVKSGGGKDVINSKGNDTQIDGGSGDDKITSKGNSNTLSGGDGNDTISSNGKGNSLHGNAGKDDIKVSGTHNKIYGDAGNDTIYISCKQSYNEAYGGSGDDRLYSIANRNKIYGETGNDYVYSRGCYVTVDGGSGHDTLYVIGTHNLIQGGEGNDRIYIAYGDNVVLGGKGNDMIQEYCVQRNNEYDGGSGSDRIYAGGGSDKLIYTYGENTNSQDYYDGGSSTDSLVLNFTGNEVMALAQKQGLNDIDAFIDAIQRLFNSSNEVQFSKLGFNLTTKNIERLDIKVKGQPDTKITANNDSYDFTQNDDAGILNVLANDRYDSASSIIKVNGQAVNVNDLLTLASGVTLKLLSDGSFQFNGQHLFKGLALNEVHQEKLTYTISNGRQESTASININIKGLNDKPESQDDDFSTQNNTLLRGNLLNDNGHGRDTDIDGDAIRVVMVNDRDFADGSQITLASGALLTLGRDGNFVLDHNGAFNHLKAGEQTDIQFSYVIEDSHGALSEKSIVTIVVTGTNHGPVANNDSFNVNEDSQLNGDLINHSGSGKDTDQDGDSLSLVEINGQSIRDGQVIDLAGGKLTIAQDGTFNFDTFGQFNHLKVGETTDITFTYRIKDSHGALSNEAKAKITINGQNDAPLAMNDEFKTAEDAIITGNLFADNGHGIDVDIDGDAFSLAFVNGIEVSRGDSISLSSGAILTINSDGSFSYDANGAFDYLDSGESAKDSFNYQIKDSHGLLSEKATANITITGKNDDEPQGEAKINVSDTSVVEGDSGVTYLAFTVSLTQASSSPVTVNFTTAGGSASGVIDADFTNQNGSLTFAAGVTQQTIRLEVKGDNQYEADETVNLNLFDAVGASINDGKAIGTIRNDDSQGETSDVPILNSLAGSQHTIYLDFDGATIANTSWNRYTNYNAFDVRGFSKDSDYNHFNSEEVAMIKETWARVAEDFAPFNVNVTTDLSVWEATDSTDRLTAVITPDKAWYGSAGGVAYLNVFGRAGDYYQPAWAFVTSSAKSMAEVISHEIGHNLGLGHDGSASSSYYRGHGSGDTGWAGIMGVGYSKNLTQWSKGEYNGANNQQDDLSVMSSKLGYRTDDHGDDALSASLIHLGEGLAGEGIIETNSDVDVFKMVASGSVTFNVDNIAKGTNIDILAVLKDADGNVLKSSNPTDKLNASITYDADDNGEVVYLEISGIGKGDVKGTGYSDYASLGYYQIDLVA